MKSLTLIVPVFFFGIQLMYSQPSILETKITVKAKNKTVSFIFRQISSQTGYFFTYSPEIVDENKRVSLTEEKASIKKVLSIVLNNNEIKYKTIEDHIIIYKDEQNAAFFNETKSSSDTLINLFGKITNKRTGKAIPFVSVGILNTATGTIANKDGVFFLKVKTSFKDSTLYFAHIGYETKFFPLSESKDDCNIQLTESFISIQEIIIRTNNPLQILRQALKNIPKNYLQKQSSLNAFYREGVQKKGKLLNFSEAIITIYKTAYKPSFRTDKIKIEKSRKIINTKESDTLTVKLKDGLYSGLKLDIVKASADFLEDVNMPDYKYRTSDIVTFGNKLAYVIEFEQKESVRKPLYKGRVFVETETLAIISAEFELNLKKGSQGVNFLVKKSRKLKSTPISASYKVSYKAIGNRYVLSHVRADLELKIKSKKDLFSSKYKVFFETVIFNIDTTSIKSFDKNKIAPKNRVFIDSRYIYDAGFWEENNFIKPEVSILDALKQIKVKLKFKN